MIPFDLVADTSLPLRCCASSKPWRTRRSVPRLVKIDCWVASSSGSPRYMRPPTSEYSPSTFSRKTTMSISSSLASGTLHAGHAADRPQREVLVEGAANRDQQAPQRDVVRHTWRAHRAEEDRVVAAERLQPVLGHHRAGLEVPVAAPGKLVPLEPEAVQLARALEHALGGRDDLVADPVARDRHDAVDRVAHLSKCSSRGARLSITASAGTSPSPRSRARSCQSTSIPAACAPSTSYGAPAT